MRPKTADAAFVGLGLLLAAGMKAYYSRAGASELAFVLTPSCWLAAHLGGIGLVEEDGAGYISHAHRMVVGPACAGVNFLIIAFLAVIVSRWMAGVRDGVRGLLIASVAAYAATILTNGLRIILAAHLFQLGGIGSLTPEQIHRLAGVLVYCLALVTLCRTLTPHRGSLVVPLACYVGVTIGLPLMNGAARNRLFVEHALVVTAVSLLVLAVARAATKLTGSIHRQSQRATALDGHARGAGGGAVISAATSGERSRRDRDSGPARRHRPLHSAMLRSTLPLERRAPSA